MIDNVKIIYRDNGVKVTLEAVEDGVKKVTSSNLAEMFLRVIQDTNVNPLTVLEKLNRAFGMDLQ